MWLKKMAWIVWFPQERCEGFMVQLNAESIKHSRQETSDKWAAM